MAYNPEGFYHAHDAGAYFAASLALLVFSVRGLWSLATLSIRSETFAGLATMVNPPGVPIALDLA